MRAKYLLFPLFFLVATLPAAGDETAQKVLDGLQQERGQAGAEALVRRADLDSVARIRAERIAGMSHDDRLSLGESIEARLHEAGITGFRHAAVHMDMVRGYTDPSEGFLRSWRGYSSAFRRALDPRYEEVGIATHTADDGWIILISIMLERMPDPGDPRELEVGTIEAINKIRRERGLPELVPMDALAEVARAHSGDMMRRGYFDHESPEGLLATDRVRAAGIPFLALGENIQRNQRFDDPVQQAVKAWMESDGHRKAILDPRYCLTGVGIAIDEEWRLYFTQLFLRPKRD